MSELQTLLLPLGHLADWFGRLGFCSLPGTGASLAHLERLGELVHFATALAFHLQLFFGLSLALDIELFTLLHEHLVAHVQMLV